MRHTKTASRLLVPLIVKSSVQGTSTICLILGVAELFTPSQLAKKHHHQGRWLVGHLSMNPNVRNQKQEEELSQHKTKEVANYGLQVIIAAMRKTTAGVEPLRFMYTTNVDVYSHNGDAWASLHHGVKSIII
eukprot:2399267-Amphidinium_carterae.1